MYKILVVAGNYSEYLDYLRQHKVVRSEAVYVQHPHQLRGVKDSVVNFIGTALHRADIEDFRRQCSFCSCEINE